MRTTIFVAAAMLFLFPPPAQAQAQAQPVDDDSSSVRETVESFKAALTSGDSATAMALLHPDVRIFEGGHAETRDQYRSGHLGSDMAFLGAVDTETTWSDVRVEGDLALFLSEYTAKGTFRDREIDAHGTETIVLARTDAGWLIRHIHWSSR